MYTIRIRRSKLDVANSVGASLLGGTVSAGSAVRTSVLQVVLSVLLLTVPVLEANAGLDPAALTATSYEVAVTATADAVVATLLLDPAQLEFERHEGYDLVSLEGAHYTTEPALPMLPLLNIQLLLPPDTRAEDLSYSYGGTVYLPDSYVILPAPRPARFSSGEAVKIPHPKAETYGSVLPYPREIARLAGGGSSAGYRMADILVTPLQYVPATGELLFHTRIEITIDLSSTSNRSPVAASLSSAAGAAVVGSAANPGDTASYTSRLSARDASAVDYIIICAESFTDAFQPLADWKTKKGVKAEIVTLESIYANPLFDGRDDAEEIRNCIRQYFSEDGTSWVLLGGDTNIIPARRAYDFFYDQGIPADLYYSALDGSWNDDDDGRWGEIGSDGVDMYADVFVGRAPVSTTDEAAIFVDKVLVYEGASFTVSSDFQTDMLFLAEILWDSPNPYTDGGIALDMIDDGYVPDVFGPITKLYESSGNLSTASAVQALEDGYGIIVHEGHANISTASVGPGALTSATLDGLCNGERGGLWYSVGCWSAAIDYDTFGEHWLTNSAGGGVAYVGNSRYGWGCPGYPGQCVSDLYSQRFFESLFTKDLVHAGLVHADAKHNFIGLAESDDYTRYVMYELNLLGDPELPIWTDAPSLLTVNYDDVVQLGNDRGDLEIEVTVGGSPVGAATVCLMTEDGEIYVTGETDAAGRTVLTIEFDQPREAMLTVTAHNCVPFGGTIGLGEPTSDVGDAEFGSVTALHQNYPNPFNPMTGIAFSLAERGHARIAIYDVSGRLVRVLIDEDVDAGPGFVAWNGRDDGGRDVASGTYFARMSGGGIFTERKMVLMR